jgi:phosphate acetyltransferase
LQLLPIKYNLKNIKTDGLRASFTERNFGKCYSIISSLNNPTIKEIVDELMPKVLFGEFLNNEIGNFSVEPCSCTRNYLLHLKR